MPAKKRLLAVASYFKSARLRASSVLQRKLAKADAWRMPRRCQFTILDDLQVGLVVGSEPLVDVTGIEVRADQALVLRFSNGERRLFPITACAAEASLAQLTAGQFAQARMHLGALAWPGGMELAPEILYDLSQPA